MIWYALENPELFDTYNDEWLAYRKKLFYTTVLAGVRVCYVCHEVMAIEFNACPNCYMTSHMECCCCFEGESDD
jgi:anaerobic ribonucleoside-triphosphate reductase